MLDAPDLPSYAWLFFLPKRPRVILSNVTRWLQDPLSFLTNAAQQHGDIVCLEPGRMYLVSSPDYVQHVLQDNHQNYCKGPAYQFIERVLGKALLTSDGDEWLRQRRLVAPAFQRQHNATYAAIMAEVVTRMLDQWASLPPRPISIRSEMSKLTLGMFLKTMFSTDLASDSEQLAKAFLTVERQVKPGTAFARVGFLDRLPTPGNLRFRRALRTVEDFVFGIIASRRRRGDATGDLLSILLHSRDDETGDSLTDRQTRDQILVMLNAGHELTCETLTWTWYLLSLHAPVAQKLREEVDTVIGDRPVTFADLPRLTYTAMVIQESLRLYPPAWGIGRTAIADDSINGYRIPAKSFVAMSPYVIHRSPGIWPEPEAFVPERFSPESAHERHRFAYFPFGSGPRICPASGYALLEIQLVIAMVSQRYRFELVPGQQIRPKPLMSLKPDTDIWMTLHNREQSSRVRSSS